MAEWMKNKEYCKAIYSIEEYLKNNDDHLPDESYVGFAGFEVGRYCKELALDYFGESKLFKEFSKKYKTKAIAIFKNRKKEIMELYKNNETVKEQPTNIEVNESKEDEDMVMMKHFVSINNVKGAYKLSGLDMSEFSRKSNINNSS